MKTGNMDAPPLPQVSNAAVQAKTGKQWSEWIAVLDEAGARHMDHKAIVAYLKEHHDLEPWWQQMVTVTYEQVRGLRAKHQQSDGYQISASKTVAAPVTTLYAAWQDDALRRRWLPDHNITIRKATADTSMRITWRDGSSSVEAYFSAKGEGKSQVAVQHRKLLSATEAAEMKVYWSNALQRLKEFVEA